MKSTPDILEQIIKQREEKLARYNPVSKNEEILKRNEGMKTFDEWQEQFKEEFIILDADGFDRDDPYFDQRLYSKDEFKRRSCGCTCRFKKSLKEILNK